MPALPDPPAGGGVHLLCLLFLLLFPQPAVADSEGDVRLVEGSGPHEGRVEIFHSGTWGTVCDDSWDLRDATVVCRQLGYGTAVGAPRDAVFGRGSGPILYDDVRCSGSEASLTQCVHRGLGVHDCGHWEDAGVICANPGIELVGGSGSHEGRVEVYHNGTWGTVCGDGWDLRDATVVCRQLGNLKAEAAVLGSARFGSGRGPILFSELSCIGNESVIAECGHDDSGGHNCSHNEDVGVVCVPLRLVGGSSEAEGRVEVFHRGCWGTVCGFGWDLRDATVVCRQLGYGTAVGAPRGVFGSGSGPIMYDYVRCSGSEASLTQCAYVRLEVQNCGHWKDAGVICTNSTCASVRHLAMWMQTLSVGPLFYVMCNPTDGCLGVQCTAQGLYGAGTYYKFLLRPCQQPRELLLKSGSSGNQVAWEEVLNHSREVYVSLKTDATAQLLSVTFEDWNDSVLLQVDLFSRDTVVPIVPLAVIPLDDGLCNAMYPLPANTDPVVPSVIVTVIVIAGLVAGLVAIPACVWLRRRKKTTAPVGGAQGQDTAAASAPVSCETSQKPPVVVEVPPVDVSQWEMRYQDLVLKKQIGSGQGGTVILACLKREGTSDTVNNYIRKCQRSSGGPPYYLLVALKRFRAERMRLEMDCFYREVAVMMKVSTRAHPNVISMVGCIPEQPGPAIVMEYAPLGNLHAFLLKYKNKRLPAILPGTVVMPPVSHVETEFQKHYDGLTLEPQDVLHFGRQIASGMEFLASLNILHRDLACRNILLAHDKVLKLADFGLSREVEDTYLSKSVCSLPVRWMAPESVVGKTYTEKSDVWSFGVVLWEICTLGQLPYQHLSNSDAAKAICTGDKLTKPNGCNPELYSVMTDCCWETEPDKRATFSVLKRTLDGLLPDSQQTPPVDLDCELRQQAKEVCPTAPPTQQGTLDATGEDESEIPATLTCWSDPDPRTSEGAPQGNISSCDTTPEDGQVAAQSAVGDDLEITPYSCVTRAAMKIQPPSPPTVEDESTPLPRLAPPNLVVTPPPKGGDTAPLLPPPRRRGLRTGNAWEMRYKDLKLELPLGCGKFGTVVRATLCKDDNSLRCAHPVARLEMGQGGSDHQWRVAVKRLSDSPTGQDMEAFYNEVAIMKRVSRRGHPHVITMVGYIPREYPPAIVMEFAPLSTLLKFLMKVKDDHTAALVPGHVRMPPPAEVPEELWSYYTSLTMEPSDVLSFGYQIASGMEFLTGLGILHRDLSSRNILMTTGKYLKLADFGLSRETKGVYVSQCFSNLPFRWMAPEALTKLTYTEKSDVWSFGVVLWEMCSLGRLPYYHVRAEHVRDTIVSGGKLTKPDGCNPELYSVMTERCWDVDPAKRATFFQLKKIFDGLLRAALLESCPYMDVVFVVQEQLLEECPGLLSSATGASRQPATAEADSTTPEGAGTEGNPDPAAEGGSTPAATGGQDEAEEIPLVEVHDRAAEVLDHSSSAMDDVLFVTPV